MSLFGKPKGKKYHTRTLAVSTYEYDEQRLIIEGCLTDRRFQEYQLAVGGKGRPPGILHQIIIHLLVNKTTLEIEDLYVEMSVVPHDACLEALNSLKPVKGLRITHGFTSKVKALVGRGKGCTHIMELLTSLVSSAMQGYFAYRQHNFPMPASYIVNKLGNTCWAWRSEGPIIKSLKESQQNKK